MVNKRYINKVIDIALFVLFFIILQIIHVHTVFHDMFLPNYFFLDIFLVFALGTVVLLFRSNLFDVIYLPIIYIVITIFSIVNVTFNNTTGDIFSLANLALIDNAGNVAASAASFNVGYTITAVVLCVLFIGALLLPFFLLKVDRKAHKELYKKGLWKKYLICGSLTLFSFTSYGLTLLDIANSTNTLDTIMLEKVDNFKDYGMLSYYMQEVPYILNGVHLRSDTDDKIKKEFDVFKNTANGDYTGLLQGYNVVNIVIETGDDLMLNKTLAPTLYSLFDDGLFLPHNYSKNKTNMSEFIGMTGSAPVAGIFNGYEYNLPFSLPYILQDQGYRTMYFHDAPLDKDVYKRRELMPKLNFAESYFREDMFGEDAPGWDFSGSYSLDSDAMPVVADIMLKDTSKPIYGFYTTLSMHGPYAEPVNHDKLVSMYGDRYYEAVKNQEFVNPLKGTINEVCVDNFMMAVMDFDCGLKKLIDKFKEAGQYDNTLFVLYGDHEMYYIGADKVPLNKTLTGNTDMSNAEMYKTVMCFSNPTLKAKIGNLYYDQFTSPYNVVPTVLDLLGIKHNPNWYLGYSLFSEEMRHTQVFYTVEQAGFFNEDFWAHNDSRIFRVFDETADKQAFLTELKRVVHKAGLLDTIYTNDYFTKKDFKDYNTSYNL